MQVELAPGILPELLQLAVQARPHEACALLGGRRRGRHLLVDVLRALPNLARDPGRFRVDPLAALAAIDTLRASGRAELGWFHSHPDQPAAPSAADTVAAWPDMLVLIAGWRADGTPELCCYVPARNRLLAVRLRAQRTTSKSSMSNTSVELPGICSPLPNSP